MSSISEPPNNKPKSEQERNTDVSPARVENQATIANTPLPSSEEPKYQAQSGSTPLASSDIGNNKGINANQIPEAVATVEIDGASATITSLTPTAQTNADPLNPIQASEIASPQQIKPEMPASYIRLKEYCEKSSLKCNLSIIDPDYPVANIEFPNGRKTRTVNILQEENAETLLAFPLPEVVFLGEYSAVCSYGSRWIEAAIRPHGIVPRGLLQRRLFGKRGTRQEEPAELEIREVPVGSGLSVKLTEKAGILSALEYSAPLSLRIEGIGITEHDKALNLLEDISNSIFMQIDFRFDIPLAIARDRSLSRRLARSNRLDEDSQIAYPRHSYEKTPSALYWYARSATSMPLLQFLAFYQCIEFFFPQFSRLQTIAKIKNVLKDPLFDGTKDSDINLILNTVEGRKGFLIEERKQLRATLEQCVDPVALRDFLNETEQRKTYYTSEFKKICDKRINLSDDSLVVEQTADRIYDLRCKVVHTKNLDGSEEGAMILPFSKEAELLVDDVDLIKFLARKVLVASSIPFKR
jgi:hypothetical protein